MKRKIAITSSILFAALTGCSDTLVYGDRTGFNLAIRTDATQGHPLEVNAGLNRRVVGHVPDTGEDAGEAVNMVSSFNLLREGGDTSPLTATLTIDSSFASGAAALAVAGSNESTAAIFDLDGITASTRTEDVSATNKILDWLNADPSRAIEYNDFLVANGVPIPDGPPAFATATNMAINENNAAVNLRFVSDKKL